MGSAKGQPDRDAGKREVRMTEGAQEFSERMKEVARFADDFMQLTKSGVSFAFLVFATNPDNNGTEVAYIGNSDRSEMVAALAEFVKRNSN